MLTCPHDRYHFYVRPDTGGGKRIDTPLMNINLELSRRLLDLTERQRVLQVQRFLDHIVAEPESDVILLDNVEILFDVALRQDPMRILQGLSRSRTVAACSTPGP